MCELQRYHLQSMPPFYDDAQKLTYPKVATSRKPPPNYKRPSMMALANTDTRETAGSCSSASLLFFFFFSRLRRCRYTHTMAGFYFRHQAGISTSRRLRNTCATCVCPSTSFQSQPAQGRPRILGLPSAHDAPSVSCSVAYCPSLVDSKICRLICAPPAAAPFAINIDSS